MGGQMNLIWPNLFETSPHVINAVMGAIDGMRCCLGPTKVLQYTLGPLPPGAQGARRLLEGLQQPLHWRAGGPRARLPAHRRRRAQPVPADAPRALLMSAS